MTLEYYDRSLAAEPLVPAKREAQDAYWLLRSQLTEAIARDWQAVCDSSPEIARAADNLQAFVGSRPNRSYRIFRPEDSQVSHDAESSIFVR